MKKILAILVATLFCVSCAEEIFPDSDMYSVKYEYNAHWGGDLNLNMDYTFQFTDEYGVLGGVSYGDTETHTQQQLAHCIIMTLSRQELDIMRQCTMMW